MPSAAKNKTKQNKNKNKKHFSDLNFQPPLKSNGVSLMRLYRK